VADEDLIAAIALGCREQRLGAERVAAAIGEAERNQADRQSALGRRALELGARRILGRACTRRLEHHQREWALVSPHAASGRADGMLHGRTIEHDLRLAARAGDIGLYVAGGIGDQAGERRIVACLAPPGGAHQGLTHRLLQRRRRLSLDVNLVYAHRPRRPRRRRAAHQAQNCQQCAHVPSRSD